MTAWPLPNRQHAPSSVDRSESMVDAAGGREVTTGQCAWACIVVVLLTVTGVVSTPFASMRLLPIPGYMAAFGSVMMVINLLLAVLLFSKGSIERRGDATRLGAAYLFVAVVFVPLVASFPGALLPGSIIGTSLSAVWLWAFWHAGFAILVARYAWLAGRPERPAAGFGGSVVGVVAACVVLALVATVGLPCLPPTMADGHTLFSGASAAIPAVILSLIAVALALVCRLGARTHEQLWLAVAMVAALFDVWLTYRGVERFTLGWYVSKLESLLTSLTVLVTLLHEVTLLHARAAVANAVLTDMVQMDGLTGINNRRRFDELFATEWRRAFRDQQPVSLLMIDVDFFKNYNDRYGHLEGDACLRRIGTMLASMVGRPADSAARYGGEEFVLLLPATDAAGAVRIGERVLSKVREMSVPHLASAFGRVTLSVGLATAVPGPSTNPQDLLAEADEALYRAKTSGRDRASWADDRHIPTGAALLGALTNDPPEASDVPAMARMGTV